MAAGAQFLLITCLMRWCAPFVLTFACVLCTALMLAEAKAPGERHCYRDICHLVRSVIQTEKMIGTWVDVVTSHYDDAKHDRFNTGVFTSSGTRFDANDPTVAASSDFPDGTQLLVWNPSNGRAAHIRVTDFGPFYADRTLDVTRAAAEELGFAEAGVATLRVSVVAGPDAGEPVYLRDREYPRVGGFLGVYRGEELSALSRLLVLQAKRPIDVKPPVRMARYRAEVRPPVLHMNTRSHGTSARRIAPDFSTIDATPVHVAAAVRDADLSALSKTDTAARANALAAPSARSVAVYEYIGELHHTQQNVGAFPAIWSWWETAPDDVIATNGTAGETDASPTLVADRGFIPDAGTSLTGYTGSALAADEHANTVQDFSFILVFTLLASLSLAVFFYSGNAHVTLPKRYARAQPVRIVENGDAFADVEIVTNKSEMAGPQKTAHAMRETDTTPNGSDPKDDAGRTVSTERATLGGGITTVAAGTKIAGNLSATGEVVVEGYVEGDCTCEALVIKIGAVVAGRVKAQSAVIAGSVEGDVAVCDLEVRDGAHLKGDVRYKDLHMEHGAILEASVRRDDTL